MLQEGSQWSGVVNKVKSHDKQKKEVDVLLHSINKARERVVAKKEGEGTDLETVFERTSQAWRMKTP